MHVVSAGRGCCAGVLRKPGCCSQRTTTPCFCPPPPPPLPQILRRSGTERQKRLAQRIQPVLQRPHVLLCTLLVCNALAAEALPLVLDRLADPATAIVVSVTVVLLFGECRSVQARPLPVRTHGDWRHLSTLCAAAHDTCCPPAFPCLLCPHAGEIIPQAACSRYGLEIGATSAPFVQLLMYLTAPLSYPIGWVLDRVLGDRHTALFRCVRPQAS